MLSVFILVVLAGATAYSAIRGATVQDATPRVRTRRERSPRPARVRRRARRAATRLTPVPRGDAVVYEPLVPELGRRVRSGTALVALVAVLGATMAVVLAAVALVLGAAVNRALG